MAIISRYLTSGESHGKALIGSLYGGTVPTRGTVGGVSRKMKGK